GGQYILKGRSNVFHILLVAHKEDRCKFMEKNYDLLPTQAKNAVDTQDKRRATLFRRFGTEGYDNPEHYNLILNMSKMSMEKAADIVCKMLDKE
ncbi:MAG: cytidylate kinase family protein, partial [Deltaproteobacteria bacterium]|nr:cytidylate kinase family protein [Deltaproteobacteria bacterium]